MPIICNNVYVSCRGGPEYLISSNGLCHNGADAHQFPGVKVLMIKWGEDEQYKHSTKGWNTLHELPDCWFPAKYCDWVYAAHWHAERHSCCQYPGRDL